MFWSPSQLFFRLATNAEKTAAMETGHIQQTSRLRPDVQYERASTQSQFSQHCRFQSPKKRAAPLAPKVQFEILKYSNDDTNFHKIKFVEADVVVFLCRFFDCDGKPFSKK